LPIKLAADADIHRYEHEERTNDIDGCSIPIYARHSLPSVLPHAVLLDRDLHQLRLVRQSSHPLPASGNIVLALFSRIAIRKQCDLVRKRLFISLL
jgi:hypothetical protein